ncbi:hypothetical protein MTQ22_09205 [Corynebacterium bovis]|uniref:hypothetical protein n=1 Tax=Corynebacterium bovis TaxID=36808 RepID=UPI003139A37C
MNEDVDYKVEPDDERPSRAEGEAQEPEQPNDGDRKERTGFPPPVGFSQSLQLNMDDAVASVSAPLQEKIRSAMFEFSVIVRQALLPGSERFQERVKSIMPIVPAFSVPPLDLAEQQFRELHDPVGQELLKRFSEEQAQVFESLRKSLGLLFDHTLSPARKRALWPPNLRDHGDEITESQIRRFVEQEAIPLYLVPRWATVSRLLEAKDRNERLRVLDDCYETIMDDCKAVLERTDHASVSDQRDFVLEGIRAMRAGHTSPAQALFTVTLDTLIAKFFPDRNARRIITNHKTGADVPNEIGEKAVPGVFVWLPIWNAHGQFWNDKGDNVPESYSRHASVHGVSSRQYNRTNCVQALMLVTSLIGLANRKTCQIR